MPTRSASIPFACSITTRLAQSTRDLFVHLLGFGGRTMLEEADGGHISECPCHQRVALADRGLLDTEEIQSAGGRLAERSGSASADRNPAATATFEKWGQGPDPGRRLSIEELCTRGMQSQS